MKETTKVTTTKLLANGTSTTKTGEAQIVYKNTSDKEYNRADIVKVLSSTKEELKEYIVTKYSRENGWTWGDCYDHGNGIFRLLVKDELYDVSIVIHPAHHLSITDTYILPSSIDKLTVSNSYYILCDKDGILSYQPREVNIETGLNEIGEKQEILGMYEDLIDFKPYTSIHVNFEGGYAHMSTTLPSYENPKYRYVGCRNKEPIIYVDVTTESDSNNNVIKETRISKILSENIDGDTVLEEVSEYDYSDKE